ncbi:MAG TPA: ABC transporter substrate-binding protein, partial [Bradyrhizobium sp.]
MSHISRWKRSTIASAIALAAALALPMPTWAAGKTITAVMHSDLRFLDPIITTAY